MDNVFFQNVREAAARAGDNLLRDRNAEGYWPGLLSASAVSTSVALIALSSVDPDGYREKIKRGLEWLCANQNEDGGWGDTDRSPSNYPATILSVSALSFINRESHSRPIMLGEEFISRFGGFRGIMDYYGADRTFSVPIKTVAALAGLISWSEVPVLPYEAVLFPRKFLRALGLPVVSYGLPALCAVGMLGQKLNPQSGLRSFLRARAESKAMMILENLQPESGGYLEAAPLTGFVAASLAALGKSESVVLKKAVEFLVKSQRADGSWPIEENLSVWNTAIALQALNACGIDITGQKFEITRSWYMRRQRGTCIYAESPPGGFAWTDLPGGVPDGDDTGAALVMLNMFKVPRDGEQVKGAISWCAKIQNNDGGWPTFCKGWGELPFDRSSADITAHVLMGLLRSGVPEKSEMIKKGVDFLVGNQLKNGSWPSLWFGNELEKDKQNYTQATSQVLRMLALVKDAENAGKALAGGVAWMLDNQNPDGGWGPAKGVKSSPEETAFALIGLLEAGADPADERIRRGVAYLLDNRDPDGSWRAAPIGLYFAQLWYYEKVYARAFPLWALCLWMAKCKES